MKMASKQRHACERRRRQSAGRRKSAAFTLLEVMFAFSIFFVAIFSILGLVTRSLKAANDLQKLPLDAGMLAAQLSLTNSLEEGSESGDFGEMYPNASWQWDIYEVASNGLYRVDFRVLSVVRGKPAQSTSSMLIYRP